MLLAVSDNIARCHRCPYRQKGCKGACPCLVDNADIILHAKAGYCPKKKYGDGARPEGFGEPKEVLPQPTKTFSEDAVKVIEMEERGLGDDVEAFAKSIGADRLAKLYEEITGWGCGCSERKKLLNRLPSIARLLGWTITRP